MGKVFLYQKVYEILPERIRKGIYVPGGKLPGDDILSDELKVSAITLKKAPEMLADSGYVRRGREEEPMLGKKRKRVRKGGKAVTGICCTWMTSRWL
nr:GntR family transcriptional regulator [uncultured Eisenbergiella sp.]